MTTPRPIEISRTLEPVVQHSFLDGLGRPPRLEDPIPPALRGPRLGSRGLASRSFASLQSSFAMACTGCCVGTSFTP